ncbi:hypothetical protein ACUXEY_001505 [Bacillus sp. F9_6S_D1_P_5]
MNKEADQWIGFFNFFVNKAILFALSIGTNYHLHCTYFV